MPFGRAKYLTIANRKEWKKLMDADTTARDAVYAAAPDNRTPYNDCWKLADEATRAARTAAQEALTAFEARMVGEGRGYRSLGNFFPYQA